MKKQQSGFTLIELIMVIVVLGILAAFALPKFVNLGGDARAATLQGAFASVKSASAMAHSSYLAKNDSTITKVGVEDGYVALIYGYPAAKDATDPADGTGIAAAAGLSSADFKVVNNTAGTVAYIHPNGVTPLTAASDAAAVSNHKCVVIYTEATSSADTPEIEIVADDCNS